MCKSFCIRCLVDFWFRSLWPFSFGVCVNRSVLLNLGPLWSGLSSRHDCRHVHAIHVDSGQKVNSQCWCAVATESVCVVFRSGEYVNQLFALSHCFFFFCIGVAGGAVLVAKMLQRSAKMCDVNWHRCFRFCHE